MNYCILLHIDRESHFVILSFLHILVLIFVLLGFFSFLFFLFVRFFSCLTYSSCSIHQAHFPDHFARVSISFILLSFSIFSVFPLTFFVLLTSFSPHISLVLTTGFFFYSFIYPFIHFTFLVRPQPARSDLVRPFLPSRFPVVADSWISGVKDTLRIH